MANQKRAEDPNSKSVELAKIANRGIQLCRDGYWKKGLGYLAAVAESKEGRVELPGRFYSYLGYGIANFEKRYKEGLELCRHAVETEFYQPENYLNLASTYLLVDARRSAVSAIERGLAVDPKNEDLLDLRDEVGRRLRPILPFLTRSNPVNRMLGKVRYSLLRLGSSEA